MSKTKDKIREYEYNGEPFVEIDLTVTLPDSDYGSIEALMGAGGAISYMEERATAALMNEAKECERVQNLNEWFCAIHDLIYNLGNERR